MTRGNKSILGPFVPHRLALLNSCAWQALSGQGFKVLSRIELELMRHGGKDNGQLVIPYNDFQEFGAGHKPIVARAIREAEALGLLVVRRGRGGNGRKREPSKYRLTYLPANGAAPTDDWSKIASREEAQAKLQSIKPKRRQSKWFKSAQMAEVIPFPA
jgi:hypothetical protein